MKEKKRIPLLVYIIFIVVIMDILGPQISEKKSKTVEKSSVQNLPSADTQNDTASGQYVDFTVYSLEELKNVLPQTKYGESVDVWFRYEGSEELTREKVASMLVPRTLYLGKTSSGIWQIIAHPYAGDRMLAAYRSNDWSKLSNEESEALQVAISILSNIRKTAQSDLELERMIHDWMCDHISYYETDFSIENSDRRQLNAVGALLDGRANCQGYTDCFYLLGNMAGFTVDRQRMPNHVFNTIKLGNEWYIVDVTHNDGVFRRDSTCYHNYHYFNAGLSDTDDRSWSSYEERNPISQVSGPYYYYDVQNMGTGHNYLKAHTSLESMAQNVITQYISGQKTHHLLLRAATYTHDDLLTAILAEAERRNVAYNCWAWSQNAAANTYFMVIFD